MVKEEEEQQPIGQRIRPGCEHAEDTTQTSQFIRVRRD